MVKITAYCSIGHTPYSATIWQVTAVYKADSKGSDGPFLLATDTAHIQCINKHIDKIPIHTKLKYKIHLQVQITWKNFINLPLKLIYVVEYAYASATYITGVLWVTSGCNFIFMKAFK